VVCCHAGGGISSFDAPNTASADPMNEQQRAYSDHLHQLQYEQQKGGQTRAAASILSGTEGHHPAQTSPYGFLPCSSVVCCPALATR